MDTSFRPTTLMFPLGYTFVTTAGMLAIRESEFLVLPEPSKFLASLMSNAAPGLKLGFLVDSEVS